MSEDSRYRNWGSVLAQGLQECDAMIANGEVGKALKHLESLPFDHRDVVPILRIQMLHTAGLATKAFEELRAMRLPEHLDAEVVLRFAHVCADAGADLPARDFLSSLISAPLEPSSLSIAVQIANRLGDRELIAAFEERMIVEQPASAMARRFSWAQDLVRGAFAQAALNLGPDATQYREALFGLHLALVDTDPPDFTTARTICRNFAKTPLPVGVVQYALAHHFVHEAVEIALDFAKSPDDDEAHALLAALDALLLRRETKEFDEHIPAVERILESIVEYLATRPERGSIRNHLRTLLSVERSGEMGLPLILAAGVRLADQSLALSPDNLPDPMPLDTLEATGFFDRAVQWIAENMPCVPGRTILPRNLIPVDPALVLGSLLALIQPGQLPLETDDDFESLHCYLLLATAVAPHTRHPEHGIAAFRIAAVRLAMSRQSQVARDICEQMLSTSSYSPIGAQNAWFAMADIYGRVNDRLTSAIAFVCALAGRRGQPPLTGWNEIDGWVRLLRDSKLFDHARDALDVANEALIESGEYGRVSHRQDFLALTIDFKSTLMNSADRKTQLPELMRRACAGAIDAISRGEEATQSITLLTQLIHLCETDGVAVPGFATNTLLMLAAKPTSSNPFVRSMTETVDPVAALWELYRGFSVARYAADTARDAHLLMVPARNMLTRDAAKLQPESLLLPFELLADSGVPVPGWIDRPMPPRRFNSEGEMREVVAHLESHGIALVIAALNNRGELFSLRFHNGQVELVEENGFNFDEFREWAKRYPFDYCKPPTGANWIYSGHEVVARTLEGCQWHPFPECPVLLILDPQLRSLPSNLLLAEFKLIGQDRAVGAAPSLAWLAESFRRPAFGAGRLEAWISGGGDQAETLNYLIRELSGEMQEHGVNLDTGQEPPASLAGADFAMVAAHGQVSADGRYFHALNDEGTLRIAAETLARSLRNVRVAVLFICSGGRSDKVPDENTTSGLAKGLLDAGCCTVIASPWPLDSTVTLRWLPTFLDFWKGGATAIEACHMANRRVDREDPTRGLAMNLYGDPCQLFASPRGLGGAECEEERETSGPDPDR